MTLLESLYTAERSLDNTGLLGDTFKFNDWTTCTCGHIYQGAIGKKSEDKAEVRLSGDATYRAALIAVIEANELHSLVDRYMAGMGFDEWPQVPTSALSAAVSDGTVDTNKKSGGAGIRDSALYMVRKAIAAEEKKQEEARLNILKQIENVVGSVDIPSTEDPTMQEADVHVDNAEALAIS